MPADHVGERPLGRSRGLAAGHDRKPDRMSGADAAGSLVPISNAIKFDADSAGRDALNRQFDVEKAERGVVVGAFFIEIERADFAVHARTEFAVPGHLRVGPRRRARGRWPQGAELSIRIALSHRSLPDCAGSCRPFLRSTKRKLPD